MTQMKVMLLSLPLTLYISIYIFTFTHTCLFDIEKESNQIPHEGPVIAL